MNYKALKARSWCASLTDTLQRRKRSRFAHLAETQGRIEADLPSIPGKPWLAAKRLSSQGPQADRKLGSSGAFSCHLHVGSAITCLLKEDSAKDGLKKGLEKKKKKESSGILIEIMLVSSTGGIFSFFKFIFNWRIIALQCCIGFCYATVRIGHQYTYVPSVLSLPPARLRCPSRFSRSTGLSSLCYTAASC